MTSKMPHNQALLDRIFWRCEPVPITGCWLWPGKVNRGDGYPYWRHEFKTKAFYSRVHRDAWEAVNGPIPAGLFICHKCDTKTCVNPDHLYAGTAKENAQDCRMRGPRRTGPRCKLTWELVAEIRASTKPNRTLAREYCVDVRTIKAVRSGKTWRAAA